MKVRTPGGRQNIQCVQPATRSTSASSSRSYLLLLAKGQWHSMAKAMERSTMRRTLRRPGEGRGVRYLRSLESSSLLLTWLRNVALWPNDGFPGFQLAAAAPHHITFGEIDFCRPGEMLIAHRVYTCGLVHEGCQPAGCLGSVGCHAQVFKLGTQKKSPTQERSDSLMPT